MKEYGKTLIKAFKQLDKIEGMDKHYIVLIKRLVFIGALASTFALIMLARDLLVGKWYLWDLIFFAIAYFGITFTSSGESDNYSTTESRLAIKNHLEEHYLKEDKK